MTTHVFASFERIQKQTADGGTVGLLRLLQTRHGQRSLNPHIGKFVADANQHGLVNPIKEVVVNLGVLGHTSQQLVDQLAHAKTHSVAAGFVRLARSDAETRRGENTYRAEKAEGLQQR